MSDQDPENGPRLRVRLSIRPPTANEKMPAGLLEQLGLRVRNEPERAELEAFFSNLTRMFDEDPAAFEACMKDPTGALRAVEQLPAAVRRLQIRNQTAQVPQQARNLGRVEFEFVKPSSTTQPYTPSIFGTRFGR